MALIDLIAQFPADRTALIHPDSDFRLTYAALRQQVQILAGALADAGVRPGDRIATALPNGPALVVAVLAASAIGVAIPMTAADTEERYAIGADRTGHLYVTRATSKGSDPGSDPAPSEDIALVLQTRGTNGPPKRVPLSHANLSISARHVAATLGLGPGDVSLCVMPTTHVHGLVTSTLATLATGGTVVIPSTFHPLSFWRVARDHGVTWFTAAPSLHQWLLARTADPGTRRPAGAARLRFIRSAGATLPAAVRQTLESAFGVPVVEGYEVTEAAGEVAATSVNALHPTAAHVAILDADGQALGPDVRGEVALAGPTLARGYENDPEASRKFFVDGWFRTGDFGYLDAGGHLTLVSDRR